MESTVRPARHFIVSVENKPKRLCAKDQSGSFVGALTISDVTCSECVCLIKVGKHHG